MNATDLSPTHSFGQRDPDARGYFGDFGGRFVPETLVAAVEALTEAYFTARQDPTFRAELTRLLTHYVGRPTPLWEAARLGAASGGARVFLKREDLKHTGAHKINNALGQALLARRMGASRASSPRPAPVSTVSPRPRPPRSSAWNASSTWAPRTWRARR